MKVKLSWVISTAVVLLVTNIPLISVFIGVITGTESLKGERPAFSSGLGGFRLNSENLAGAGQERYDNLIKKFETYKATHPKDTVLYRHFGVHPLRFWAWYRYWLNRDSPFNQLPYKDPPTDSQ